MSKKNLKKLSLKKKAISKFKAGMVTGGTGTCPNSPMTSCNGACTWTCYGTCGLACESIMTTTY